MAIKTKAVRIASQRVAVFYKPTAIVIPAYNEAQHLPRLIDGCRRIGPKVIVAINDGSTDNTGDVLARQPTLAGGVRLKVIENEGNLGKQGSVLRALRFLVGEDRIDRVVLIDGDGQHDPAELPALAALLDEGFHMVIGARRHKEMPRRRRLSNWLVNTGFSIIGGVDFYDVQSGLRVYTKALADVLAAELLEGGGYGLEHESLSVLAAHAQRRSLTLRVAAAPASCSYGMAESTLGPDAVIQLAYETFRQALRIRRAQLAEAA